MPLPKNLTRLKIVLIDIGAIWFEIYMYVQHRMRKVKKLYIEKCLFISVIIYNFELDTQLWQFHYVD